MVSIRLQLQGMNTLSELVAAIQIIHSTQKHTGYKDRAWGFWASQGRYKHRSSGFRVRQSATQYHQLYDIHGLV